MEGNGYIIEPHDLILITGATGFIGRKVVQSLLNLGFRNLRCFVRRSSELQKIRALMSACPSTARVELIAGNLLSPEDCRAATRDVTVIVHLAAARGEKSFPEAFRNSVVTTRNLLDATLDNGCLRRFVNVSSFTVYRNKTNPRKRLLDESCPVEERPELRADAYCFAKTKQDEIVTEYGKRFGIPHVIVRPGFVYGPGSGISGRVGIGTFGIFLHLGGANTIPLTYVDNCADAIALAGVKSGIDGEVFNVVDDDLPSSRQFLRLYKRHVKQFRSLYLPHFMSYFFCYVWERYSAWSAGQLEPAFNLRGWHTYWKKTYYSNEKLKTKIDWRPKVRTADALRYYFEACRTRGADA